MSFHFNWNFWVIIISKDRNKICQNEKYQIIKLITFGLIHSGISLWHIKNESAAKTGLVIWHRKCIMRGPDIYWVVGDKTITWQQKHVGFPGACGLQEHLYLQVTAAFIYCSSSVVNVIKRFWRKSRISQIWNNKNRPF